ncbi:hypothetical protein CK203_107437 [Vitis vinifera]|uniref:Uncharacterized protein n=1 Tax=Vitis vinifera TaxID=29760 RepID=A0A438FHZ7_VITVI|nr:hypothetical protein CK203_107437 [Vitis vinifera]
MAIMERMDHFQLRQNQQTLILREIHSTSVFGHQLPLFLLCPQSLLLQLMILIQLMMLHPVAIPSTVAAEDPSYPPEEPTT